MLTNDERKVLKETRDDLKRILRRIESTLVIDETSNYVVTQYLMKLGVPTSVTGFGYIKSGVLYLLKEEKNKRVLVTKELYPKIAEEHNCTPQKVERAIRTAIKKAEDTYTEELDMLLYGREDLKLTNSDFLTMVTEMIRMEL